MKYYYDVLLNFNEYPISYYEWDSTDTLESYKDITIFRVDNIQEFIKYHMCFDIDLDMFIISDCINAFALDLIDGKVVYISSLSYDDEACVNEIASNMEVSKLKYKRLKRRIIPFELRIDLKYKRYLLSKINESDDDFIRYMYFDITDRDDNNIDDMRAFLVNDINTNFNDKYVNLYKKISK